MIGIAMTFLNMTFLLSLAIYYKKSTKLVMSNILYSSQKNAHVEIPFCRNFLLYSIPSLCYKLIKCFFFLISLLFFVLLNVLLSIKLYFCINGTLFNVPVLRISHWSISKYYTNNRYNHVCAVGLKY